MPALFVGHGSPMQAIEPNRHTAGMGTARARVQALLAPDSVHGVADDRGLDHGSWSVLLQQTR